MQNITFKDLLVFVLRNKGTTTFMGYSMLEIASMLHEGVQNNLLYYSTDSNGNISGMILAELKEEEKVLFVTENLSMNLSNLKAFARKAKEQFKGYKIEAIRHCRHVKFDTNKLYNKLS